MRGDLIGVWAEKVGDAERAVNGAIEQMVAANAKALRARTLLRACLLRLTYDSGGGGPVARVEQSCLERQEARWDEEKEAGDVYRLSKDYKMWRLVYRGEKAVLADERAVELVAYLLRNPPEEPIHATGLEVLVDGAPTDNGAVGGVMQEATGAQLNSGDNKVLKDKLRDLKAAREDERLPESERSEAAEELEKLLKGVAKVRQRGGQAGRAAERVRKALRRFIDELKVAERRRGEPHPILRGFGQHLEECLYLPSVGGKNRVGAVGKPGCFTYLRPNGVVWRD